MIPRVREVADYAANQQAAAHHRPMVPGDIAAAPYLRHKELLPGMYEEHQVTEYDLDDRDLAWLSNVNTKVSSSRALCATLVHTTSVLFVQTASVPHCSRVCCHACSA